MQSILCLINIWQLQTFNHMVVSVAEVKDPFSDASLLSMLLIFNNIQRLFFRIYDFYTIYNDQNSPGELLFKL